MKRSAACLTVGVLFLIGCGGADGDHRATTASATERERRDALDTRAIEKQVTDQLQDRLQRAAMDQGSYVAARTRCTKQSETAYKCLTSFTSPPAQAEVITNVTCDRNGQECITESTP